MKLVPFSSQYLRLAEPLPFGVRDATGRLLLGAGQSLANDRQIAELRQQTLYCDELESAAWNRRLVVAVNTAMREGATLGEVATTRPEASARPEAPQAALSLPEYWHELVAHLDQALREARPATEWRTRLFSVHGRARQMSARRLDASLYHMVFEAGQSTQRHSCHHALMTLLMSEEAASTLQWPQGWVDSLGRAALTMNVAVVRLQDQLAQSRSPATPSMRAEIEGHALAGARQLEAAGLGDPLALEVVRLHHEAAGADEALAGLAPERQIARLLRRVDMFAEKISRLAARAPVSPVQAAREACLGAGGVPDEIGGALLKAVGLYPPGSFVELVNGEVGIVIARGRRANLPFVATLVSASGTPLGEPALRDTVDRRYAVKGAVAPAMVKVRPPHERLLAMR